MIRVRLEFVFVLGLTALVGGPIYAGGWLLSALMHEATHGGVARLFGGKGPLLDAQLGAGDAYVRGVDEGFSWVLGAGPFVSVLLVVAMVGVPLGPPAAALGAFHWALFQIFPHPSSDGGVLLRRFGRRFLGERRLFALLAWGSALVAAAALTWMWRVLGPRSVEPLVPWVAVAVLMAFSEWPAVVHGEAWRAWRASDPARALSLARRPLGRRWAELRRLGLEAALELQDSDAVAEFADGLPTLDPTMLRATAWMLQRDDARGARWAERLVDVMSAGAPGSEDAAEVVAEFGLYEARREAWESSLGLLEQACAWGFDRVEWLDFRPEVQPLRRHPRWMALS